MTFLLTLKLIDDIGGILDNEDRSITVTVDDFLNIGYYDTIPTEPTNVHIAAFENMYILNKTPAKFTMDCGHFEYIHGLSIYQRVFKNELNCKFHRGTLMCFMEGGLLRGINDFISDDITLYDTETIYPLYISKLTSDSFDFTRFTEKLFDDFSEAIIQYLKDQNRYSSFGLYRECEFWKLKNTLTSKKLLSMLIRANIGKWELVSNGRNEKMIINTSPIAGLFDYYVADTFKDMKIYQCYFLKCADGKMIPLMWVKAYNRDDGEIVYEIRTPNSESLNIIVKDSYYVRLEGYNLDWEPTGGVIKFPATLVEVKNDGLDEWIESWFKLYNKSKNKAEIKKVRGDIFYDLRKVVLKKYWEWKNRLSR